MANVKEIEWQGGIYNITDETARGEAQQARALANTAQATAERALTAAGNAQNAAGAARENADAANAAIQNAETAEIKDGDKLVKESAVWETAFLRNHTTSTPATRSPAGFIVRDANVISQNYYFDKTVNLAGVSIDFSESGIRFYILGADGKAVRSHFVAWQS